ncbi:MAG: formyltransferase family protein [Gemmatimonadota bacterium]|nr:formyltransferase family protein [Gemmatimonadota bacterium]
MTRVVVLSSCDRLADIACEGLFAPGTGLELAGILRTRLSARTRWRLLGSAHRAGSLFYARYMAAEMSLPGLWRRRYRPASIRGEARAAGAPILETTSVNGGVAAEFVASRRADLVLSVRPGTILRKRLIDSVPPVLNVHGSMLPEFRGIAGVLQALAEGREELGCSVHLVPDERVDRGPIVSQSRHEVVDGRSVYFHTIRLYRAAPANLLRAARRTLEGAEPEPNAGGSYFSWPDRADLARLHARGHRLIEPRDLDPRNLF